MIRQILQGRLGNHPLHSLLVHLPIGLWVIALVFDIIYMAGGEPSLPMVSYQCIKWGLIGAILALASGAIEFVYTPPGSKPRAIATTHALLNLLITGVFLASFVIRQGDTTKLYISAFVLSCIGVSLLLFSGYLGGLLVFQYGQGRNPKARVPENPDINRAA